MNYYVAGIWWFLAAGIFGGSFWFPYDWHRHFPQDGWMNAGVGFMFLFWYLAAMAILKGVEWGIRFSPEGCEKARKERV